MFSYPKISRADFYLYSLIHFPGAEEEAWRELLALNDQIDAAEAENRLKNSPNPLTTKALDNNVKTKIKSCVK
jgi:hypothetical protein